MAYNDDQAEIDAMSSSMANMDGNTSAATENLNNNISGLRSAISTLSSQVVSLSKSTFEVAKQVGRGATKELNVDKQGMMDRFGAMAAGPIGIAVSKAIGNSGIADRIGSSIKDGMGRGISAVGSKFKSFATGRKSYHESGFMNPASMSKIYSDSNRPIVESLNRNVAAPIIESNKIANLELEETKSGNKSIVAAVQTFNRASEFDNKKIHGAVISLNNTIRQSTEAGNSQIVDAINQLGQKFTTQSDGFAKGAWEFVTTATKIGTLFKGKYTSDIQKSNNPLETLVSAQLQIYRWQRLYGELTKKQLNEIIKATGGEEKEVVGKHGLFKEMMIKNSRVMEKMLGDGFLGKAAKFLSFDLEEIDERNRASMTAAMQKRAKDPTGNLISEMFSSLPLIGRIGKNKLHEKGKKTIFEMSDEFDGIDGLKGNLKGESKISFRQKQDLVDASSNKYNSFESVEKVADKISKGTKYGKKRSKVNLKGKGSSSSTSTYISDIQPNPIYESGIKDSIPGSVPVSIVGISGDILSQLTSSAASKKDSKSLESIAKATTRTAKAEEAENKEHAEDDKKAKKQGIWDKLANGKGGKEKGGLLGGISKVGALLTKFPLLIPALIAALMFPGATAKFGGWMFSGIDRFAKGLTMIAKVKKVAVASGKGLVKGAYHVAKVAKNGALATKSLKGAATGMKAGVKTLGAVKAVRSVSHLMKGGNGLIKSVGAVAKSSLAKAGAKIGLKGLIKRIPVIGSLLSIGFAISRFKKGEIRGGLLELLSGGLGLIDLVAPGLGTALSLGVDLLNVFLDNKKEGDEKAKDADKKGIGDKAAEAKQKAEKLNEKDKKNLGPNAKKAQEHANKGNKIRAAYYGYKTAKDFNDPDDRLEAEKERSLREKAAKAREAAGLHEGEPGSVSAEFSGGEVSSIVEMNGQQYKMAKNKDGSIEKRSNAIDSSLYQHKDFIKQKAREFATSGKTLEEFTGFIDSYIRSQSNIPREYISGMKNFAVKSYNSYAAKNKFEKKFAKGGILKKFGSGGHYATQPTNSVDASGQPIQYGEAGTEAIIPITAKPGNLLNNIGLEVANILYGKGPTGPMSKTSTNGKGSVHASDQDSRPITRYLANSLAKIIRPFAFGGFVKKFDFGGFANTLININKGLDSVSRTAGGARTFGRSVSGAANAVTQVTPGNRNLPTATRVKTAANTINHYVNTSNGLVKEVTGSVLPQQVSGGFSRIGNAVQNVVSTPMNAVSEGAAIAENVGSTIRNFKSLFSKGGIVRNFFKNGGFIKKFDFGGFANSIINLNKGLDTVSRTAGGARVFGNSIANTANSITQVTPGNRNLPTATRVKTAANAVNHYANTSNGLIKEVADTVLPQQVSGGFKRISNGVQGVIGTPMNVVSEGASVVENVGSTLRNIRSLFADGGFIKRSKHEVSVFNGTVDGRKVKNHQAMGDLYNNLQGNGDVKLNKIHKKSEAVKSIDSYINKYFKDEEKEVREGLRDWAIAKWTFASKKDSIRSKKKFESRFDGDFDDDDEDITPVKPQKKQGFLSKIFGGGKKSAPKKVPKKTPQSIIDQSMNEHNQMLENYKKIDTSSSEIPSTIQVDVRDLISLGIKIIGGQSEASREKAIAVAQNYLKVSEFKQYCEFKIKEIASSGYDVYSKNYAYVALYACWMKATKQDGGSVKEDKATSKKYGKNPKEKAPYAGIKSGLKEYGSGVVEIAKSATGYNLASEVGKGAVKGVKDTYKYGVRSAGNFVDAATSIPRHVIGGTLKGAGQAVGGVAKGVGQAAWGGLKGAGQAAWGVTKGAGQVLGGVGSAIWNPLAGVGKGLWKGGVKGVGGGLLDIIKGKGEEGVDKILKGIGTIGMETVKGLGKGAWGLIKGVGKGAWSAVSGITKGAWSLVKGIGKGLWSATSGIVKGIGSVAKGVVKGAWGLVSGTAKGVWNLGKTIAALPYNIAKGTIKGVVKTVVGVGKGVKKVWNGAKTVGKGIWGVLTGKMSLKEAWNGIKGKKKGPQGVGGMTPEQIEAKKKKDRATLAKLVNHMYNQKDFLMNNMQDFRKIVTEKGLTDEQKILALKDLWNDWKKKNGKKTTDEQKQDNKIIKGVGKKAKDAQDNSPKFKNRKEVLLELASKAKEIKDGKFSWLFGYPRFWLKARNILKGEDINPEDVSYFRNNLRSIYDKADKIQEKLSPKKNIVQKAEDIQKLKKRKSQLEKKRFEGRFTGNGLNEKESEELKNINNKLKTLPEKAANAQSDSSKPVDQNDEIVSRGRVTINGQEYEMIKWKSGKITKKPASVSGATSFDSRTDRAMINKDIRENNKLNATNKVYAHRKANERLNNSINDGASRTTNAIGMSSRNISNNVSKVNSTVINNNNTNDSTSNSMYVPTLAVGGANI